MCALFVVNAYSFNLSEKLQEAMDSYAQSRNQRVPPCVIDFDTEWEPWFIQTLESFATAHARDDNMRLRLAFRDFDAPEYNTVLSAWKERLVLNSDEDRKLAQDYFENAFTSFMNAWNERYPDLRINIDRGSTWDYNPISSYRVYMEFYSLNEALCEDLSLLSRSILCPIYLKQLNACPSPDFDAVKMIDALESHIYDYTVRTGQGHWMWNIYEGEPCPLPLKPCPDAPQYIVSQRLINALILIQAEWNARHPDVQMSIYKVESSAWYMYVNWTDKERKIPMGSCVGQWI